MDTSFFSDPAFYLLIAFIVPLILRVPIAVALGLSALGVAWYWDMGTDMLSYNFFAGIAKVPLLAIPFFILAGYIMERAGIASRIVRFVESLVGGMTGGLGIATVAVATFWGAVLPLLCTEELPMYQFLPYLQQALYQVQLWRCSLWQVYILLPEKKDIAVHLAVNQY